MTTTRNLWTNNGDTTLAILVLLQKCYAFVVLAARRAVSLLFIPINEDIGLIPSFRVVALNVRAQLISQISPRQCFFPPMYFLAASHQ